MEVSPLQVPTLGFWGSPLSGVLLKEVKSFGGLRNPFSPLSLSRLLGLLGGCLSGGVPVSGFWWSQDSPSRLPGVPLLHCCHSPFSPFQGSWGSPLSQPSLGVPKTGVSPSPPGLRSLHVAPGRAWRAQPRKPNPHHGEDSHPPALHWGLPAASTGAPQKHLLGTPQYPPKAHLQLGFGVLQDPSITPASSCRKKKQGAPNIFRVSSKYSSLLQKKPPRIFRASSPSLVTCGMQGGARGGRAVIPG